MYYFVSYPRTDYTNFIDILDYVEINKGIKSGRPFKVYVLETPTFKRFLSLVTATRINATTIRLTWKACETEETNVKNELFLGDLYLIWARAEDTLVRDPSSAYRIDEGKAEDDKVLADWGSVAKCKNKDFMPRTPRRRSKKRPNPSL